MRGPLYGVGRAGSQAARGPDARTVAGCPGGVRIARTHNVGLCLTKHDVMARTRCTRTAPRRRPTVQTTTTTDSRVALCADASASGVDGNPTPGVQPLFPPKDADAEARRRWLASSPWPEVVFAAAI